MGFYTTLIPLVGVLGVTMLKDGYDDVVSHRALHVCRILKYVC